MVNATITDRDLCAARALMRWTQGDLADAAGVPIVYIRRFERGAPMKEQHLRDLVETLTEAGVVFFGKVTIGGGAVASGVALKASAAPKAPFEKRVYPPRLDTVVATEVAKRAKRSTPRQAQPASKTLGKSIAKRRRPKPAS